MYPKEYFQGIATLTGCIIGAGILGIPYVVAKAGFWTGLLVILVVGISMLCVNLMVADIVLASKKPNQLVGYAGNLLGKKGKILMLLSMIVGVYGAMVAYTVGVSQSFSAIFGGDIAVWAMFFYAIMGAVILGSIHTLAKSEFWMEAIKVLALAIILAFLFKSSSFTTANLQGFSLSHLFLPYGVILFAYIGTAAVPEVCEEMRSCRHLAKRAIIIGSIIPILAYSLFTIAVVGVGSTSEIASIGASYWLGKFAFVFHLFAILAMTTSFAALAYALKEVYWKDLGIDHSNAWALTMVLPALLLILGFDSFIKTLDLTGAFTGGLTGILIIFMHYKATKSLRWSYVLLIALFALGIVYQLLA